MTSGESAPSAAARTPGSPRETAEAGGGEGHAAAGLRARELALLGSLCAIAAGIGYGTLGIFTQLYYDAGGGELDLLVLRFTGATAILVVVALARSRPLPDSRDTGFSILAGIAILGATACLFAGFDVASPGLVVLLFYIYPLITTVAGYVLFGEHLTRDRVFLLILGLVGIALTVGVPTDANAAGIAWGLSAGVCTAAFILIGRHLMNRSVDSFQFAALGYTGAAIALLPVALVIGVETPPADSLVYGALLIVVGTALPTLMFYFAIHRIGAGAASRLATIEPVTAVVLSYVVLGDAIAAIQLAGGALVVTAVVLLATPGGTLRRRRPPQFSPH